MDNPVQQDVKSRALDIGCAVGRASFELARAYQEVVGIDYSSAFVNVCQDLKAAGEKPYILKTEGDLGESKIAKINPNIVSYFSYFALIFLCMKT